MHRTIPICIVRRSGCGSNADNLYRLKQLPHALQRTVLFCLGQSQIFTLFTRNNVHSENMPIACTSSMLKTWIKLRMNDKMKRVKRRKWQVRINVREFLDTASGARKKVYVTLYTLIFHLRISWVWVHKSMNLRASQSACHARDTQSISPVFPYCPANSPIHQWTLLVLLAWNSSCYTT